MKNVVEGEVIEALPDGKYRLLLDDGSEKLAFLAGKMRVNKIRVLLGDRVSVELDPYGGKTTNRIVRRL